MVLVVLGCRIAETHLSRQCVFLQQTALERIPEPQHKATHQQPRREKQWGGGGSLTPVS